LNSLKDGTTPIAAIRGLDYLSPIDYERKKNACYHSPTPSTETG
jgi:hypothetical protein